MLFPILGKLRVYANEVPFARAFEISKLTDEQRHFYGQFISKMKSQWDTVFYFGVVTILIGILLLVADRKKKSGTQAQ